MNDLISEARRLTQSDPQDEIEYILHPGGRAESGFVTFFLYREGRPACLAKVARTNNALIKSEAENLEAAAAALGRSPLLDTIDRALGTAEIGGKFVLFKKFSTGHPAAQMLATTDYERASSVLGAMCDWLLRFIDATSPHHVRDEHAKRSAALALVDSGRNNAWVDVFGGSEHHFLGPAHGDLVPANVLMDGAGVRTVVDFENFDTTGFPLADFVGLIISTASKLFGLGDQLIDSTFRNRSAFSCEVARQIANYCNLTGCDLDEFVSVLPLYADRALAISNRWGMTEEFEFHERLREFFLDDQPALISALRSRAA